MREMHKWKDKVELSLDNRQIFFLFFGLSIIGCFVFALGVMTGRRIDWEPVQQAAALGSQDSLAMLDEARQPQGERFAFQQGLVESDAAAIPPTRDPEIPPRAEGEVRAERAEQQAAAEQREAEAAEVEAKIVEQQQALAQATAAAAQSKPAQPKPAQPDSKPVKGDGRRFTLQMKAFSSPEDATKLADKLRHDGHEVRIESHDVRGRTWHRVRLGEFDTWEDALAAKQAFEKSEHIIAYVVSL